MAERVTEEIPITPETEDEHSKISETGTSFNTTTSMGETGEPTLKQVLHRVCKLHKVPQLEDYLKLLHISNLEEFAIAEQEDFHSLVPDIGRLAVRKLMILSNYCKVHGSFPPTDIPISQVQKELKQSGNWEEFIPIPQSPMETIGVSPDNGEESVNSSVTREKEILVLKEAGGHHSETEGLLR